MSEAITRGIHVEAEATYDQERSDPSQGHHFFSYRIRIQNLGSETAQLLSRHWIITDGDGHIEQVRGPGVVGEQPVLPPGGSFEYVSFCPLPTDVGTMQGSYQMRTESGELFDAEIAAFTLSAPHLIN
jgi:ApaG protein